MKDGGKEIGTEVMHHWFNLYGADLKDYMKNNFDKKWEVLDNNHKSQIDCTEAKKFIRDFISGIIQL